MTTIATKMNQVEGTVSFQFKDINFDKLQAEIIIKHKSPKKRKWEREETITVGLDMSIRNWFKLKTTKHEDGFYSNQSGFQKYLAKRNIEYKPKVLLDLVFECKTDSDSYADNPFRLTEYVSGKKSLTFVNKQPKRREVTLCPVTGKEIVKFSIRKAKLKDGKVIEAFYTKDKYRRLIQQEQKAV